MLAAGLRRMRRESASMMQANPKPDALWRSYNRTRSVADRNAIFVHFWDTAASSVAKLKAGFPRHREDIDGHAAACLCRMIEKGPDARFDFKRTVATRIPLRVLDVIRGETGVRKSGFRYMGSLEAGAFAERVPCDSAELRAVDDLDAFEAVIKGLRSDQRRLLRRYYVDGRTLKAIGVELGLSESGMCRRLRECLQDLKGMNHG